MNKNAIIINSIEKNFEICQYTGEEPKRILKSITVNFDIYDIITDAKIGLYTKVPLSEEEIKDKIVEVINS